MSCVVHEQNVPCLKCGARMVVEYAAGVEIHSPHVEVRCLDCHALMIVVLPRPAAVFMVRRVGDESVMQARLG
jgi:ribosomal protein S27E